MALRPSNISRWVPCAVRAAISGRVEVNGEIKNHFADGLDDDGCITVTIALDSKSYGALKNRWMRCQVETE